MDEPAPNPFSVRPMPGRSEFDEQGYLDLYPDVALGVAAGAIESGWQHFAAAGFREGRSWLSQADSLAGVSRDISPRDEMLVDSVVHYFDVGVSALHCVETALFAAGRRKSSVKSLLDLPCGHGRVMRFLKQAFPAASLTACDLSQSGVEFCAQTFGAHPVFSREAVAEIPLPGGYDLIWCGSLLTHLPEEKWSAFIQLFQRVLCPGGILVFTTHGRRCATGLQSRKSTHRLDEGQITALLGQYQQRGFGYVDYVAEPGYGFSLASPSFVLAHFVQPLEWELLGYHESLWDKRQDVVCLQRPLLSLA